MSGQTVRIAVYGPNGQTKLFREVPARFIVGQWAVTRSIKWAVTRSIKNENSWEVTHIPSGYAAGPANTFRTVKRLANALSKFPEFKTIRSKTFRNNKIAMRETVYKVVFGK